MKKTFTREILFLFFLFLSANIYGQGVLSGIVTDSLANEALVGANVYLKGTALGAAVTIDGEYKITRIPEGKYTVIYSYVGYKPKQIDITIYNGRTLELFVELVPDIIRGTEVVVSAQALGQAAAINQQLSSNTIVNVVSEQKIQELPDANAAEAIGRLPGVSVTRNGGEASQVVLRGLSSKFTPITIDGVRIAPTNANDRGVDLSVISQGSLSGIEMFKAITADKDADALAGSVNLVTKKAPSNRVVKFDALGSYNGLEESAGQYNFVGRYGERFWGDKLGVQVIGNLERKIRSSETSNYDYSLTGTLDDYEISEFNVTYSDEIRKRTGGSLLLDFDTPDGGTIRFNNVYNETSRDWITHNRNYHTTGGVAYEYRDRESKIKAFSSSLRGENYLLGFDLDWNIAFSESKVETPYDYQLNFSESAGMENVPQQYWKGPVEEWIPFANNNFELASLGTAYDRSSNNYDNVKTAFVNILRKYVLSNDITGELKFGGKYYAKNRSYTPYESVNQYGLNQVAPYVLSDGTFALKDWSGTRFDGLVGVIGPEFSRFLNAVPGNRNIYDKYDLYPLIDRDAMRLWRELEINSYKLPSDTTFNQNRAYLENYGTYANNTYEITEKVTSAYIMNTFNFGSLVTLITGVRIESDNNDYSAFYSPVAMSGFNWSPYGLLKQSKVSHTETSVLPNFHVIIKPTGFLNLRLAAYKALARPDFSQRLPRFSAIKASSPNLHVGNPNLKNAEAWNFEVQTQFYGNDIGLFSVNFFYKDIKNMQKNVSGVQAKGTDIIDSLGIDWRRFTDTFPLGTSSYSLYYTYNSTKPTKVWGIEVEHQANFRFLPGLLKNIVLDYNFTFVRSETYKIYQKDIEIPRPPLPPLRTKVLVEEKESLEDQPEFSAKAAIGYDYEGFSFRLSVYYQGEYDRTFSSDRRDDGVTNSFTRWDVAVKQDLTDYLSLVLNINNLTNAKETTSRINRLQTWGNLEDASNLYGLTVDLGARITL